MDEREVRLQNKADHIANNKKQKDMLDTNKTIVIPGPELKTVPLQPDNPSRALLLQNCLQSYDLQETIRKIQSFSSFISERERAFLSEAGKESCNRMQKNARRLQQLLHDLSVLSNLYNSSEKPKRQTIDARVRTVLESYRETLQNKGAKVFCGWLDDAKIIPDQFTLLMRHIIDNAIKFTNPEKTMQLIICSKIVSGESTSLPQTLKRDKKYCHIKIEDNGLGFDYSHRELIFEMFQRMNPIDNFEGNGIGLCICRKITDNHAGCIVASGYINRGASIDVFIPA